MSTLRHEKSRILLIVEFLVGRPVSRKCVSNMVVYFLHSRGYTSFLRFVGCGNKTMSNRSYRYIVIGASDLEILTSGTYRNIFSLVTRSILADTNTGRYRGCCTFIFLISNTNLRPASSSGQAHWYASSTSDAPRNNMMIYPTIKTSTPAACGNISLMLSRSSGVRNLRGLMPIRNRCCICKDPREG